MADGTHIEWADATWSPVRGCSRVSPGCGGANHEGGCYAERIAARFSGPGQPFEGFARRTQHGGQWTGKLALVETALDLPLRWKKPRRIFVNSMSDLFHENLPDEAIDRVFAVMALAPQHTFQVLTKRAERMRDYLRSWPMISNETDRIVPIAAQIARGVRGQRGQAGVCERPLPNVWLGVSVEDQARADERIPLLLDTPAAVRFISAEPLLGPVDLRRWLDPTGIRCPDDGLDWVITGGESGAGARGASRAWFRSIRDQCQAAGVAYFHKQNGEFIDADEWLDGLTSTPSFGGDRWQPERPLNYSDAAWLAEACGRAGCYEHHSDGSTLIKVGKRAAGRLLDGRDHSEFPA